MTPHCFRILVFSMAVTGALAQTAQLTGVVSDDSGAAIPSATVSATNLATGVASKAQTNEAGIYRILYLQPGAYRLEGGAAGFRTYTQQPITLQVADRATVDIKLQVGVVTESVTVSADARMIESETAEFNQLVDQRTIQEMPLNTREAMQLTLLAPGFTAADQFETGSSGDSSPNYFTTHFRIGGSRNMGNEVLIDGVSNTGADKGFMQYNPPVDATQEFKVQANPYSAEYGRTSGPVVNIVTKSGTNQLHGVLYEFHRNSVLDANGFFANATRQPRPGFRRNLFGGAGGGPAIRNKLFFYADYDGQRLSAPNLRISSVPTVLQKQGDFSRTFAANGALIRIFDPLTTTTAANGAATRLQFPGNAIPQSRQDPVAANAIKYYPDPNTPGNTLTNANNHVSTIPRSQDWNRFGIRLEQYLGSSNRLSGRYGEQKSTQVLPGRWTGDAGGGRFVDDWYRTVSLGDSHTFSPTLTGEFRAGYAGSGAFWGNEGDGFDLTRLRFPASLKQVSMALFPVFTIADVSALGNTSFLDFARHTWTVTAVFSKALGRHFLKAGLDERWLQHSPGRNRAPSGTYTFNRLMTRGPDPNRATADGGFGVASFLLGAGADGRLDHHVPPALQVRYQGLFFQDDWKVSPRLTVNLGLRYSVETGISERYDRLAYFEPYSPSALRVPDGRTLLGTVGFRDSRRRNLFDTDFNNLEPRVGLAWQIGRNMVLRSGYGIFFLPRTMPDWGSQIGFSTSSLWTPTLDNGLTPFDYLSNPFPKGFDLPTNTRDPLTGTGAALTTFLPHEPLGYTQQWSFSVQRQVRKDLAVEAAYWGSKGTKLQFNTWEMNQLPNVYLALRNDLNALVPNPFFGLIASGPLSSPTVSRRQSLSPYPQYTSVVRTWANAASSIYHGMTIKADKRVRQGLGFTVSYTIGKMIDDCSGNENFIGRGGGYDMENLRLERSISQFDAPQRLVSSIIYDLPFGKGKRIGASMHPVLNAIAGGWGVGVLAQLQSGTPVAIGRNARSAGRSARIDDRTPARWFDTTAFSPVDAFSFGNVGRFLPDVRGDSVRNLDVSALKNFRFGERFRLQFRGEFFNAFNTPRFGMPGTGVASQTFGVISTQTNRPRQLQGALKLFW